MAARFPEQPRPIDTIEKQINNFFDRIIMYANARRMAVLVTAEAMRNAKIEKLKRRIEELQELKATKGDIVRLLKENILQETRLVSRGEYRHLEQLIGTLGEIREENEVPAVPRYEAMRPIVEVGKEGKAPGELWYPQAVAIDKNTNYIYVAEEELFGNFPRISIFSDGGEFMNCYTHEHLKTPYGIAIHTTSMYVSDTGSNAVFQFKIESDIKLVAKIRKLGNGEFNWPSNIASLPTEMFT